MKILILAWLMAAVLADCPLDPYPRRTVLGTLPPHIGYLEAAFSNDPNLHNQPQDYTYSLDEHFQSNGINIAVGVVGLELNSHAEVDFDIQYLPTTRTDSLKFRVQANDQ